MLIFPEDPKQIIGPRNRDAEPPNIAAAQERAFIVWHEFPENEAQPDVFITWSLDNGRTFRPGVNLSNSRDISSSDEMVIATTRDGDGWHVFVVWLDEDLVSQTTKVLFRRGKDAGNGNYDFEFGPNSSQPGPAKQLNEQVGTLKAARPRIAAGRRRGGGHVNLYVVWHAEPEADNPDIFLASSTNSGESFTVENISTKNKQRSEFPTLTVSRSGNQPSRDRVTITWRDASLPPGQNGSDIFFRRGEEPQD